MDPSWLTSALTELICSCCPHSRFEPNYHDNIATVQAALLLYIQCESMVLGAQQGGGGVMGTSAGCENGGGVPPRLVMAVQRCLGLEPGFMELGGTVCTWVLQHSTSFAR